MNNVFFTSDLHFGHGNIIGLCSRPWKTVEEMNEALIEKWNAKVRKNDTVFIMGDLFFRAAEVESILSRLKGKKRLIVGNHDGSWMKKVDLGKYFTSVDHYLEISDGKHGLTLCHYPLLTWHHEKRTYMIHGHLHADKSMDYWQAIQSRNHLLNAGVDINHFEPVTFDELMVNNQVFKETHQMQEGEESQLKRRRIPFFVPKIIQATALDPFMLKCEYETGEMKILDVQKMFSALPELKVLEEHPEYFDSVEISICDYQVFWMCGEDFVFLHGDYIYTYGEDYQEPTMTL